MWNQAPIKYQSAMGVRSMANIPGICGNSPKQGDPNKLDFFFMGAQKIVPLILGNRPLAQSICTACRSQCTVASQHAPYTIEVIYRDNIV